MPRHPDDEPPPEEEISCPGPTSGRTCFEWDGSGEHRVTLTATAFGLFAFLVWYRRLGDAGRDRPGPEAIAPYEFAGAILGSLLVMRTNAGIDRWYEAGKLWGGIINESRNLAILIVIANGTDRRTSRGAASSWAGSSGSATPPAGASAGQKNYVAGDRRADRRRGDRPGRRVGAQADLAISY